MVTPDDKGVKEPAENDVLCGRGGSINSHPGNERFRTLVEKRKRVYLTARFKREKRLIASSIVSEIRALNGRFLTRDTKTGLWQDIGDEKARDKTSQALRENAPSIRAEIETEINVQRAEMYKEDATRVPYPPQAPSSGYYSSWYPSYYGYGHPPPPPGHYQPPPPPPTSHPYSQPTYDYYGTHPDPYNHPQHPSQPKSALEQTADFVASGAESIKNWSRNSFSFGGAASTDGTANSTSKPLSYKHDDRRRMVKFRDDCNKRKRVACYSPVQSNTSIADSVLDDMEPASVDADMNTSLMTQVASHILGSIGSWDATATWCGGDITDEKVPFPDVEPSPYVQDTDVVATEAWEGQEVQLVDDKRDDDRMPPPPPPKQGRRGSINSGIGSSIGFSSLGSCHSWLPEQVSAATSYFVGRDDHDQGSVDMDISATGWTTGDGSLSRVFDQESANNKTTASPNISQRSLHTIQSWEHSLRSRSPTGDDDESLISKTSSKGGILSPTQSMDTTDMAWTHE